MLIAPQISEPDGALRTNWQAVRAQIAAAASAAGRNEQCVTLVAVSKGHAAPRVRAAAALGLADFGESYLQEALPKRAALEDLALTWHFIGRIQTNKTRLIAEHFDWVHGVDRLRIAERLSAQRPSHAPPLKVCIQVNIAAEAAKAGVPFGLAPQLATAVRDLPRLQLRGLMCILPDGRPEAAARADFARLRALLQHIDAGSGRLDTLSMGMSADYPAAILEGATLVRIGTALFGTRAPPSVGSLADAPLG